MLRIPATQPPGFLANDAQKLRGGKTPIQTKRKGSDCVEIYADDRTYYQVRHNAKSGKWVALRYYRGVISNGTVIGQFQTAEEAVTRVKTVLTEGEAELTAALDKLL